MIKEYTVSVRMSETLAKKLETLARQTRVSKGHVLRELIEGVDTNSTQRVPLFKVHYDAQQVQAHE